MSERRTITRIRQPNDIGIPYAEVDVDTGAQVCPICGRHRGAAYDRDGEQIEGTYDVHYSQEHTRTLPDGRVEEDWPAPVGRRR
jgi:hypothetical protein